MNYHNIFLIAGYSLAGLVLAGCMLLMFLMWQDTKRKTERNVAAPSLNTSSTEEVFVGSEESNTVSRRAARNQKKPAKNIAMEASDGNSLWDDNPNGFDLSNGRD